MLRKGSLNSGGQQFHRYKQNEQPHLTSNINKTPTYDVENPCSRFGQEHECGGVKPVTGVPNHVRISMS